MQEKPKAIWGVSIIGVYLYAASVLVQYGYLSYFNLPSDYIDSSFQAATVFYFDLFSFSKGVASLMPWWMLLLLVLVTLSVFFYYREGKHQRYVVAGGTAALLLLLSSSFQFGYWAASTKEKYYIPSSNCGSFTTDENLALATFHQDKVIFVPFDKNTKTLNGNFIIKNSSDLNCTLENTTLGKLKR